MLFFKNHWTFHSFVPLLPPPFSKAGGYWANCWDDRTPQQSSERCGARAFQAGTRSQLSITNIQCLPGLNSQGKEIPPCATNPFKLPGTTQHSDPQQLHSHQKKDLQNCSTLHHWLTDLLCLRAHTKFYFQFPTLLQLTLYQRETRCFKMPLQSYSSQRIPKFMCSTSRSLHSSKSKVWEGRGNCQSLHKKE